jgi:hypothetical protein
MNGAAYLIPVVEHWAENKGSEPVVLVSVDLFKE